MHLVSLFFGVELVEEAVDVGWSVLAVIGDVERNVLRRNVVESRYDHSCFIRTGEVARTEQLRRKNLVEGVLLEGEMVREFDRRGEDYHWDGVQFSSDC